jgi:hypothetical protein
MSGSALKAAMLKLPRQVREVPIADIETFCKKKIEYSPALPQGLRCDRLRLHPSRT